MQPVLITNYYLLRIILLPIMQECLNQIFSPTDALLPRNLILDCRYFTSAPPISWAQSAACMTPQLLLVPQVFLFQFGFAQVTKKRFPSTPVQRFDLQSVFLSFVLFRKLGSWEKCLVPPTVFFLFRTFEQIKLVSPKAAHLDVHSRN